MRIPTSEVNSPPFGPVGLGKPKVVFKGRAAYLKRLSFVPFHRRAIAVQLTSDTLCILYSACASGHVVRIPVTPVSTSYL